MNAYEINGYWKDDRTEFEGYIVVDTDSLDGVDTNLNDDDVFMYGISASDLEGCVKSKDQTPHDFVVTSFNAA